MKTPCDECVVLAICKAKLTGISAISYFMWDNNECPPLKDWLFNGPSIYQDRRDAICDLYKMQRFVVHSSYYKQQ